MTSGSDSRNLCGPQDGRGALTDSRKTLQYQLMRHFYKYVIRYVASVHALMMDPARNNFISSVNLRFLELIFKE